jgi:hypothetical protein
MRSQKAWLISAISILCGLSIFYMIDTGVYLSISWIGYLLLRIFIQRKQYGYGQPLLKVVAQVIIILGALFGCLLLTQGTALFTGQFWINMAERTSLFLSGHGNLPVYKSLVEGRYLETIIGLIIPIFYVLVGLFMVAMVIFNQPKEKDLFVLVLVLYGLASYHYYIVRSADTSYYVVVAPMVLLLAWGVSQIRLVDQRKFSIVSKVCLMIVLFALFTNHYFINYYNSLSIPWRSWVRPLIKEQLVDGRSFLNHHPGVWSEAVKLPLNSLGEKNEDLKTEKDFANDREFRDYFTKEFDFTQDAALIKQLTTADQPVALFSSYETRILMQADRRPFFYYFPLVDSRPMRMRMFNMTTLWTTKRLQRTLDQLNQQKPEYIFMEKIFLNKTVPASYQWLYPEVIVMLTSIFQQYTPVQEGHYLVALKRK